MSSSVFRVIGFAGALEIKSIHNDKIWRNMKGKPSSVLLPLKPFVPWTDINRDQSSWKASFGIDSIKKAVLPLKNIKGRENLIPLSSTRTASSINYQEDLLFSGIFNESRVKIYTTNLHQGGSTKGAYSDQLCKNPWKQFSAWLIPSNEAHQRECCSCIPHHRIGLSHQMSPCQSLIAE